MVSIVIPAFNEEKILKTLLDSLVAQKTTVQFEVILVDNNSTDSTRAIADLYVAKLPLRIITEKKKGRSPARRAGFEAANGEIILSTDADTKLPENWIEAMSAYFNNHSIEAISGICRVDDLGMIRNAVFNSIQPISMKIYRLIFGHYWLSGFNFGIRKKIYAQSGGFNPEINAQEDVELSFRVSKFCAITFISHPVVLFSGRRFQHGMIKGLLDYFISFLFFFIIKRNKNPHLSDIR